MTEPSPSSDDVPWKRDLDLVVRSWCGGDDARLAQGSAALASRIPAAPTRRRVTGGQNVEDSQNRVRHRRAVLDVWQAQQAVLATHRPDRLLTIGGDCSVELPSVAYLAGRYGPELSVVWLDAHGDLNSPASSPSGTAHGMPLRLLLDPSIDDLGSWHCLEPAQVLLAGVRDLDPPEEQYRHQQRIRLLTVEALYQNPGRLAELLPAGAPVYLHLDLDVLDPPSFPAVAVPTPDGLPPAALAAAFAAAHEQADIVGMGITEYVPSIAHDAGALDHVLSALQVIPRS